MFRKMLFGVSVLLLASVQAMAGGPAWLSLPLEGVTAENAAACTKLLSAKLESKVANNSQANDIRVLERDGTWYVSLDMGDDVRLSEIDAALKGSEFSVQRKALRLFGHVTFEVKADKAQSKKLIAALADVPNVSVGETKAADGRLVVTIDMPYPREAGDVDDGYPKRGSAGWQLFRWNENLASDPSRVSTKVATSDDLPSYEAIDALATRHGGALTDVSWSAEHSCRPLGGVALRDAEQVAANEN